MSLLSYVFYAFFVAGSVTLGYLLIRLTFPEVRTMDKNSKLGSAGVAGALLAIAAFGIDYAYDGSLEVLSGTGIYAMILFVLFLLSFVALKLYFMFSRPEFLTVGVPSQVQPVITLKIERIERKIEPEVRETIIQKPISDMRESSGSGNLEIMQIMGRDEPVVVAQEHVELHKKQGVFSSLLSMFGGKKDPSKASLDENSKARIVPVGANAGKFGESGAGGKTPSISAPQPNAQIVIAAPPYVARGNMADYEQPAKPKITDKKSPIELPPGMARDAALQGKNEAILGKGGVGGAGRVQGKGGEDAATLAAKGSVGAAGPNGPDAASISKDSSKDQQYIASIQDSKFEKGPRKGYMSMVSDIVGEDSSNAEKKRAQGAPSDITPMENPPIEGKKPMDASGHERLYAAAKAGQDEKAGIPAGFVKEKFQTDPKAKSEQVLKAEDAQAEAVLQDILPREVLVKEVSKPKMDGHRRLYEVAQSQNQTHGANDISRLPPGAMVHRRYMMQGDDSGQAQGVSVVANASVMQNENFDAMVGDVYSQLRNTKTTGIGKDLKVTPPKGSSSKEAQKSDLTFEDLIGEKPKSGSDGNLESGLQEGGAKSSIMSQLAGLTGVSTGAKAGANDSSISSQTDSKPNNLFSKGDEKDQPSSQTANSAPKSSIDFVKIQAEKGMGCPTCHSKNTKIIFCPYCGSGMCANCSPSIKIKDGGFVYTCPKCKEDVDIRKKTPEGQLAHTSLGLGSPG